MKFFTLFLAINFFVILQAAPVQASEITPENCPDRIERIGDTQVQQLMTYAQDNCFITTANRHNYNNMVYRNYLISRDSLLVFVSLGDGPEETSAGSKEFFFFPRDQKVQGFAWSEDQSVIKINPRYDFDFTFDAKTSALTGMTNAMLSVDPKISADNDGGVTMIPTKGLVYELPFMLGGAPSGDMKKIGVFKDAFNHQCKVRVNQIFKALPDGDSELKYTDEQMKVVLKKLCPQIRY